jgi:hypothetical protein
MSNSLVDEFLAELQSEEAELELLVNSSQSSKKSVESVESVLVLHIGEIDFRDNFSIMYMIKPSVPCSRDEGAVPDLGRLLR